MSATVMVSAGGDAATKAVDVGKQLWAIADTVKLVIK
jgi:hypothetical protein